MRMLSTRVQRFVGSRWLLVLGAVLGLVTSSARADLLEYVKKPDKAYSWKHKNKVELPEGTVYDLHLVSQVWQGITWEHQLQLFVPKGVEWNGRIVIWNQGGKASIQSVAFGMDLATKIKAPVAFVYGIPNQPLLDGKREDGLIAETFVRYLNTKDGDWPLLFPMVKSLVRAMDALQEFCKKELNVEVRWFVVSGASKRGWTTWLTGAADARVEAIIPVVIDTLNFSLQMPHQLRSFGKYSEMIKDYTERGLVPLPDTVEAKKLWHMVDPWAYRERLKMPIMIINGANDPYWTTDALNLYWDDLKSSKWVLYVPNAGHGLQQELPGGKKDLSRALNTMAAFAHHQVYKKQLPTLAWKHSDAGGKMVLEATATPAPAAARLWIAKAATRDFRKARWEERPVTLDKGMIRGEVTPPAQGCLAFFAEVDYDVDRLRYHFSTQMRIAASSAK